MTYEPLVEGLYIEFYEDDEIIIRDSREDEEIEIHFNKTEASALINSLKRFIV